MNAMKNKKNIWILIPARGGSKGIPRENLRLLGNKPLICHVLDEMRKSFDPEQIIISTDSEEIASLVSSDARIHQRSEAEASDAATLDQVAVSVSNWLLSQGADENDYLFTIQPTSPFIIGKTVLKAFDRLLNGAGSVITVKDDRCLRWTVDEDTGTPKPLFDKRLNRQWLEPTFAETGGMIGAKISDICEYRTRIVAPVELTEVDQKEGLSLHTYMDWAIADYYVRRKQIIIRADAEPSLGMGHVYRTQALAQAFSEHDITIVSRNDNGYQLGTKFFSKLPYRTETISGEEQFVDFLKKCHPNIVILDVLDTGKEYIQQVKAQADFVVSFEDMGPGAQLADLVINDLYTDFYPNKNHWYGVQNAILAQPFETVKRAKNLRPNIEHVLITFGGTDPQNLTKKALNALKLIDFKGKISVVVGPGYSHEKPKLEDFELQGTVLNSVDNMAMLMREVDIAVTSAGRTVTELMTLGIPTIVMCQNMREMRHTHASSPFGVINLGLGEHLVTESIAPNIKMLMDNYAMRLEMRERALSSTRGRSNEAISRRILEAFEKHKSAGTNYSEEREVVL
jgi:spore coat polysaccharide biosynthesis predicted glycosyltransferase SpsG